MDIFIILWLIWLVSVSVTDFSFRRVSNQGVVIFIVLGILMLGMQKNPWEPLWYKSILAFFIFLIAFLPFYIKGWMGAGDIKFMAVLGLWFGFSKYIAFAMLSASLLALLHSFIVVYMGKFKKNKKSIPYAGYMAAASIVGMLYFSSEKMSV